jgi:hypothetical protein
MNDESDFFPNWLEETLRLNGLPGPPEDMPSLLFKFVSCDSKYFRLNALELFLHNRIRFSRRSEFNDPFDSIIVLSDATPDEAKKFLLDVSRDHGVDAPDEAKISVLTSDPRAFIDATSQRMNETFGEAGIYSMSSSARHPLMWAHYASSHRGLAFVFKQSGEPTFGPMPVRYQESVHTASLSDREQIPLGVLTKGPDWKYEKEWRLVEARQGGEWKEIDPNSLYGIVFGVNCIEDDIDFVRELIQRRSEAKLPTLTVLAASKDQRKFELDFYRLAVGKWVSTSLP